MGDAKPVAQRVRRVAPQFRGKLSDLIKGLLSTKIIRVPDSPWASLIVVIIKKNGIDNRLCMDYRVMNSLTRLMVYPMPLINDLLEDLDKVLWYCSLDMASGFWVVDITERARLVSALITPFGLVEWLRMTFGLKNAPSIYRRLLDNALFGYLRIPDGGDQSAVADAFEACVPDVHSVSPVLERRSYIDDILVAAESWDALCDKVNRLLDACDRWNWSISVVNSSWGCRKVDYLGHRVSADGLEAHPKNLETLTTLLLFPRTLRSMQSFLGSLNYYSRVIENFAIYASILYELQEMKFHEMDQKSDLVAGDGKQIASADETEKWDRARVAFEMLKNKISDAPVLSHFDPDRTPVIVVYASDWAISAALMQEHDGTYMPITFTSRTLKVDELKYGNVRKRSWLFSGYWTYVIPRWSRDR